VTAERDDIVETAMGLMDEAAVFAASLDTFRRHEIMGRLIEAYALLESTLPKERDGERESAGGTRERLALLGRRDVPGDPPRAIEAPKRVMGHPRWPASANP